MFIWYLSVFLYISVFTFVILAIRLSSFSYQYVGVVFSLNTDLLLVLCIVNILSQDIVFVF